MLDKELIQRGEWVCDAILSQAARLLEHRRSDGIVWVSLADLYAAIEIGDISFSTMPFLFLHCLNVLKTLNLISLHLDEGKVWLTDRQAEYIWHLFDGERFPIDKRQVHPIRERKWESISR